MRRAGFLCIPFILFLGGCYSLPLNANYTKPQERPAEIQTYYQQPQNYGPVEEQLIEKTSEYELKKIHIASSVGDIRVNFFQGSTPSSNVVLVFPILKGKPFVENYFARYLVRHGFDSVIVNRQSDFIDPNNSDRLEEILRDNILRDRIVIDFLEQKYGKKEFGSFGISRGAINAAITAGVDPRLKHNVLVLGGSDLPKLFQETNQRRIRRYVAAVTERKNISDEQFFGFLRQNIKSDPKYLASFIDARHTLMFLAVFDRTVPFKYGKQLREQIGNPQTIFLMADHYVSLAFSQIVCSFIPLGDFCIFPPDYIETEALSFYRKSMGVKGTNIKLWAYRMINIPFSVVGRLGKVLFGGEP